MHSRILNTETAKELSYALYKFVRDGNVIAFDESLGSFHWIIARDQELGEQYAGTERWKWIVDDAGELEKVDENRIKISRFSHTCKSRGPRPEARVETGRLVHELSQLEVIFE